MKTKIFKTSLLTLLIAFLLSPVALASHKDSEQYGPGGLSGHIGQPHGHIVSGEFTFIVEASKDVEWVRFKIVKPDNTTVLETHEVRQASQAYDGNKYFKLVWNSTGFQDGNYKLFADVVCDSCTPNGIQDYVVHFAGGASLEFTVKNPMITYTPASGENNSAFDETVCQNNLPEAKELAKTILDKNSKRLLFIDDFMQQSVLFYERSEAQIENYNSLQGKVNESRKTASDLLAKLKVQGAFDCKSSLGAQIDSFLGTSAEFRDQSEGYKDNVINFILKVIEVV